MTTVALKIDVDTYRGTREGVPAMLEDLAAAGVRASFFFTVGPDRSGMAVFRVFRNRGFVGKMVRTNPIKMYGLRTMMYGTLLPSPIIGRKCASILRECEAAGHEVGLHAWDHVTWQDRLDKLSRAKVDDQLRRGIDGFAAIFKRAPESFAAPAWFCTDDGFEALERAGFRYVSVTRGAIAPFFPIVRDRTLGTIEIPTTVPTLDEMLGRDGVTPDNWVDRTVEMYRPDATEVLTVHAETEGLAYRRLFRDLLSRHRREGIDALTLGEVAEAARRGTASRATRLGTIPGRSGRVVVAA